MCSADTIPIGDSLDIKIWKKELKFELVDVITFSKATCSE